MQPWTGVMIAGAALLIVSGLPKIARPAATIMALRSVGAVRVGAALVRSLAVIEVTVGAIAIVVGGRWSAVGITVLYVGFSVFLVRALQMGSPSCGCAGRDDTPPSIAHVIMTAAFALCGAVGAISGQTAGLISVARHGHAGTASVAIGFATLATYLGWAILNVTMPTRTQPSS